jgi:hypothetical protein
MAYNFYGDPTSQAMALGAHKSDNELRAAQAMAQGQAASNVPGAQANILSTIYSQPAQFAGNIGNMYGAAANAAQAAYGSQANATAGAYGGYAGGLGGLGVGLGNAYGAYAGGLGNTATAMANERSNFYGANAMAEAARQGSAGQMGAAALGAYGSTANSAMNAWGQNQTSYNKAMSDMSAANQMALSNYGVGRSGALAQLGDSYASAGKGFAGAEAISNLDLSAGYGGGGGGYGPGGGFSANGPDGPIASGGYGSAPGGYGSVPGGDGFFINAKRSSDGSGSGKFAAPTYGGLDRLQSNLMSRDLPDAMSGNYLTGMDAINLQHYTSRGQPSQMLGQSLDGLMQLGAQGYGASADGMNQFYATQNNPRNRADYTSVLDGLASGFRDTGSQMRDLGGQMGGGYRDALGQIDRGYGTAMGVIRGGLNDARGDANRMYDNFRDDARLGLRGVLGKGIVPLTSQELQRQYAAQDTARIRAERERDRKKNQALAAGEPMPYGSKFLY